MWKIKIFWDIGKDNRQQISGEKRIICRKLSKRLKSWGLDGSDSIINQYFYRKFGIKANHLRKVLLLTKNASVKSFLLQKNKKKDSRGLEAGRFHRWVSFWVILSATNNKNYVNEQLIDQIKRILLYLSSALELWFEDGWTSLASPTSNLCPTDNLLTRRKQYTDTGRFFFQNDFRVPCANTLCYKFSNSDLVLVLGVDAFHRKESGYP